MANFVWFFGASGAGKATLIYRIADEQFQLNEITNPIICKESLLIGRAQRIRSFETTLTKYAPLNGAVLLKGQSIDLSMLKILQHISSKFPEVCQHIAFVFTQPSRLLERTSARLDDYWPNPHHDFRSETLFQIDEIHKLCLELKIQPIIIDNSRNKPRISNSISLAKLNFHLNANQRRSEKLLQ